MPPTCGYAPSSHAPSHSRSPGAYTPPVTSMAPMPITPMPIAPIPIAPMPIARMPIARMPAARMPIAQMPHPQTGVQVPTAVPIAPAYKPGTPPHLHVARAHAVQTAGHGSPTTIRQNAIRNAASSDTPTSRTGARVQADVQAVRRSADASTAEDGVDSCGVRVRAASQDAVSEGRPALSDGSAAPDDGLDTPLKVAAASMPIRKCRRARRPVACALSESSSASRQLKSWYPNR